MKLDRDFVAEVKAAADIVSLIGESVELKRSGINMLGLCPFHDDTTPSLQVQPAKNGRHGQYRCFACNEKGDVIDWATKVLKLPFSAAIKFLAQRSGMIIPADSQSVSAETARKRKLSSLLLRANSIYRHGLNKSTENMKTLLETRGLTRETVEKWQLGLVSRGICPYLKAEDQDMYDAGLTGVNDKGYVFERLRMRITIPILNHTGLLVGFAGRRLESAGEISANIPKYLNPPENILFSKSRVLFGLNQAEKSIRRDNHSIVVEGFFDVISLHQCGETRAVASMGTAFTPEQFKLILRYSQHVTFCFDGDKAGHRSAQLLITNLLPALTDGLKIDFMWLPDGDDPDSFILKNGYKSWAMLLSKATPLSEFIIDFISQAEDQESVENRVESLLKAKKLLMHIAAPIFKKMLLQRITERYGVDLMEELAHG